MKKYLLSKALFHKLLYGNKASKEEIVLFLEDLLKKNESLFITISSLNHILENETQIKRRELIFINITNLCDKVLSLDNDDLPLIIGYESEFGIDHLTAIEYFIAKKAGLNCILDITEQFKFQKTISVINLVLKTE